MSSRMSLANLLSSSDSSAPVQRQDEPADMDESELIAAAALRGMRAQNANASSTQPTPALSLASSGSYSTLSDAASYPASTAGSISRASSSRLQLENEGGPDPLADGEAEVDSSFLARASKIPIVNSTLRVYENSKNSSRVVKYAAQTVESSVMSVSRPVISRLPVNTLDEFACRQLDRWTPKGKSPTPTSTPTERDVTTPMSMDESQDRGRPVDRSGASSRHRTDSAMDTSPSPPQSSTTAPDTAATPTDLALQGQDANAVAVRSKWQTMITEAGGISAAVSDESMRRLKYCLSWLQYATARIDHQILILREFIAALTPPPGQEGNDTVINPAHLRTLNDVKQDVVKTIRDVVDVVSKYAGGALPEPARATVRAVILHLPQRWAMRMHGAPGSAPGTPGPDTSPTSSASEAQHLALNGPPTAGVASAAALRILGLATESLDMMRNVTGVFKDSLERAETWVERLRVVGIQRQQQGGDPLLPPDGSEPGPSSGSLPGVEGLSLPPISTRYRSYPPSETGDLEEHDGSVGASSPVSARLSPSVSLRQLSPSASTQSIGLGASLDALSLAALQHQAALQHGQQQRGGPRFTVGPQAASGMDVDDD